MKALLIKVVFMLICINPVLAQYQKLAKGAPVPDLTFTQLFGTKNKELNISGLRGKIIILDFWGTFCAPCLEAFPMLDSLQRKFDGKIQIIAVSKQKEAVVREFFKSHRLIKRPDILFIAGDSVLHQLFPHVGVPHEVVIDQDGKFLQDMDSYNLSEKYLAGLIEGKKMVVPDAFKSSYAKTIIEKRYSESVAFASILLPRSADIGLHLQKPDNGQGYSDQSTIVGLYQRAFLHLYDNKIPFFEVGRTQLLTRDSTFYFKPPGLKGQASIDWITTHHYNYWLKLPGDFTTNLYQVVIEDLNRYFKVSATVEKRPVNTYVLVRTSTKDKLRSKGGKETDTMISEDIKSGNLPSRKQMRNQDFSFFFSRLKVMAEPLAGRPIIDETGYKGKIDIEFDTNAINEPSIAKFNKGLHRYDLKLEARKVLLEVLVLKMPDYH